MQSPRLLPIVAFAALCLAGLKLADLVLGGEHILSGVAPATAQSGPAVAAAANSAPPTGALPPVEAVLPLTDPNAPEAASNVGPQVESTQTEMNVLESLAERRKDLDQRERELQLRENLLRAAQVKLEARIKELKALEARVGTTLKKQDDERNAQQERLVKMYTSMRPKDAARIFNQLAPDVLSELAIAMKPRTMSAILAAMDPGAAPRQTIEMNSNNQAAPPPASELPKIEARGPS
jgi:flagellar motility protein MotE (MotC chaperone)